MDYVVKRTHIIDHEKFLEAGVHARDLWDWGLLYAGGHETDGAIPMVAVMTSPWGYGGKANVKAAAKLVEVGLWERTDRGYQILKWAEMGNKTKAQLEVAREGWKAKKKEQRATKKAPPPEAPPNDCPPGTEGGTPPGTLERVLNSNSNSNSESGSREGEREREPPKPDPDVGTPTELPPWFGAALATVEQQTGETLRPPDSWLRYSGHRAGKGRPPNQQDAVYWLTTVMVPEARKERQEAARQRERDAKYDRTRAGPGSMNDNAPPTPEREAAALAVLRERMAKRKGAA